MSENKKTYEESSFWVGVDRYYILRFFINFYPTFIVGVIVSQMTNIGHNTCEEFPNCSQCVVYPALFAMIATFGFIMLMFFLKKYAVVMILYILTIWPFLCILKWWWDCPENMGAEFPLPILWSLL